jgi:hypothetical protein
MSLAMQAAASLSAGFGNTLVPAGGFPSMPAAPNPMANPQLAAILANNPQLAALMGVHQPQ